MIRAGPKGGYFPYSTMRLADADRNETIIYATEKVQKSNPQFQRIAGKTNPQLTPWYAAGAQAIHARAPVENSHATDLGR